VLTGATRKSTREYFDNSWALFETLFAGFDGEEPFYRPPQHGLRHPQIFYYGHGACLYVNKLRVAGVLDGPVDAYMESILEVGVDEMIWDDMVKNDMVWPTVAEVHVYRQKCYDTIVNIIETHPALDDPSTITDAHPLWSLYMSFEHDRIHLETSSVLYRETDLRLMQVPAHWPPLHPSVPDHTNPVRPTAGEHYPAANPMIDVPANKVTLGKPTDFPTFGWDNEYGSRDMDVPAFAASQFKVTNGEFWEFVNDGGYRDQKYWCANGAKWRAHRNMKWPFFWVPDGPQGSMLFKLRTVFEEVTMPWDWPVDCNYFEARAFCRWRAAKDGKDSEEYRVITEAEHHVLRDPSYGLPASRADPAADQGQAPRLLRADVRSGSQFLFNLVHPP